MFRQKRKPLKSKVAKTSHTEAKVTGGYYHAEADELYENAKGFLFSRPKDHFTPIAKAYVKKEKAKKGGVQELKKYDEAITSAKEKYNQYEAATAEEKEQYKNLLDSAQKKYLLARNQYQEELKNTHGILKATTYENIVIVTLNYLRSMNYSYLIAKKHKIIKSAAYSSVGLLVYQAREYLDTLQTYLQTPEYKTLYQRTQPKDEAYSPSAYAESNKVHEKNLRQLFDEFTQIVLQRSHYDKILKSPVKKRSDLELDEKKDGIPVREDEFAHYLYEQNPPADEDKDGKLKEKIRDNFFQQHEINKRKHGLFQEAWRQRSQDNAREKAKVLHKEKRPRNEETDSPGQRRKRLKKT